jgi:hypothetical protein
MERQNGPLTNGSLDVLLDSDGYDKALAILKPYLKATLSAADMKEVRSTYQILK